MAEEKSDAYYIAVGQPTNGKLQKTADESIQHTTDHVITQTAADTARQMNDETTKHVFVIVLIILLYFSYVLISILFLGSSILPYSHKYLY